MLPTGLVHGVTYKPANSAQPAHIHVRRWRGKALVFGLDNVSFAEQYKKAVEAMADSLGLEQDNPARAAMHQSSQAFLKN